MRRPPVWRGRYPQIVIVLAGLLPLFFLQRSVLAAVVGIGRLLLRLLYLNPLLKDLLHCKLPDLAEALGVIGVKGFAVSRC